MTNDKSSLGIEKRREALKTAINAIGAYKESLLPLDFEKSLINAAKAIEAYIFTGEAPS